MSVCERLSRGAWAPAWVRNEHAARYRFAAGYVRGKVVVDCGCGEGAGAALLQRAGARAVLGCDRSVDAVRAAAAVHRLANLRFCVGDGLRLPVGNGTVDVYVSFETIEHIEQDRRFLAEAVRVLRPDGMWLCSTPHRTVTNPGTPISARPFNRFHVREYALEEFLELLRGGFSRVELYGQNPCHPARARLLASVGWRFPRGAVWLTQVLKAPGLIYDRRDSHEVRPWSPGRVPEYLVAVCLEPRVL